MQGSLKINSVEYRIIAIPEVKLSIIIFEANINQSYLVTIISLNVGLRIANMWA